MLYHHGFGEVAISISGDAARPERLVHTIRGVGSVTRPILGLEAGAMLGVRGPFGTPWPLEAAEGADVVVVAGGIGLAPLRPAILHLLANRERYNRVIVLYGARNPQDLLFLPELHAWRGRFDTDVRVTVDSAGADWRGPVGVVTRLIQQAPFDPDDTVVMTCGPEIMMHFVVREFVKEGVPEAAIHLSMERSMKCAIGFCGHCQWGPHFVCRDGPVFRYDQIAPLLAIREL
ncbi:MAG: FAD/NAD(P)-binding protein [Alphaproteobacteria bacterium]|nr:FAD/NAD(P)-binding protein [Alphaproteobacteria bacterium]